MCDFSREESSGNRSSICNQESLLIYVYVPSEIRGTASNKLPSFWYFVGKIRRRSSNSRRWAFMFQTPPRLGVHQLIVYIRPQLQCNGSTSNRTGACSSLFRGPNKSRDQANLSLNYDRPVAHSPSAAPVNLWSMLAIARGPSPGDACAVQTSRVGYVFGLLKRVIHRSHTSPSRSFDSRLTLSRVGTQGFLGFIYHGTRVKSPLLYASVANRRGQIVGFIEYDCFSHPSLRTTTPSSNPTATWFASWWSTMRAQARS